MDTPTTRSTIDRGSGTAPPHPAPPPDAASTRPLAYVETTIPSFFHTTRRAPTARARRTWTRLWWHHAPARYHLVTSEAVLDELREGDYPSRAAALALIDRLPRLSLSPAIGDIATAYIRHRLMPADPAGDALHLALASFHRCDFLVTWNCRHLANANKAAHLRRLNGLLGLFVPVLATPLDLLGDTDDPIQ
jgi:hypothetical protein